MSETKPWKPVKEVMKMSHAEWLAEAERRFGNSPRGWVFVCPMCHTSQTIQDLEDAGLDKEKIRSVLGFSCVGRFTKAKGCDWTLGGLFKFHTIEVITEDGEAHPRFEFGESLGRAQTVLGGKG